MATVNMVTNEYTGDTSHVTHLSDAVGSTLKDGGTTDNECLSVDFKVLSSVFSTTDKEVQDDQRKCS
jgi:hypothetical protein